MRPDMSEGSKDFIEGYVRAWTKVCCNIDFLVDWEGHDFLKHVLYYPNEIGEENVECILGCT